MGEKGITFLVARLFLRRSLLEQLNEHLLDPRLLVLARTWLLKLIFTWGNTWELYNVESSFSESVASHLAWILSRRCIEDASTQVLCFKTVPGRRYAVGNRPLHGRGTAQARRHGAGTHYRASKSKIGIKERRNFKALLWIFLLSLPLVSQFLGKCEIWENQEKCVLINKFKLCTLSDSVCKHNVSKCSL